MSKGKAKAPALKAYEEAKAQAWKAYKEATALCELQLRKWTVPTSGGE